MAKILKGNNKYTLMIRETYQKGKLVDHKYLFGVNTDSKHWKELAIQENELGIKTTINEFYDKSKKSYQIKDCCKEIGETRVVYKSQ